MAKSKWEEVKSKFTLIEGWCRDGLTEAQIAKNLGISVSTLENYKLQHLEFVELLKKSKEVVDIEVENALLKRALGYTYEEKTYEKGELTKTVVKEVTPDTTAQIFWLKNRKPREWRDKQEIEHSGETTVNNRVDLSNLTTEQIRELLNK